jgi:hypothetical protein
MPFTIQCREETITGESLGGWAMELLTETVTVREVIRSRVYQEVQDHNLSLGGCKPLVTLTPEEVELNHQATSRIAHPPRGRNVDWNQSLEVALRAFEMGRFLLLINDVQAENLDDQVTLFADSTITFIKLTPLVGG